MTTTDAPALADFVPLPRWRYVSPSFGDCGYWHAELRAFGYPVLDLTAEDNGYWVLSNAVSGRTIAKRQERGSRVRSAVDEARLAVETAAARALRELTWQLDDIRSSNESVNPEEAARPDGAKR